MVWSVTLNGNKYGEVSFSDYNYADENTGLPAAFRDVVQHTRNVLRANSSTTINLSTLVLDSTLVVTTEPDKYFVSGQPVFLYDPTNPSLYAIYGFVQSFTTTYATGDLQIADYGTLTITVKDVVGTATRSNWEITMGFERFTADAVDNRDYAMEWATKPLNTAVSAEAVYNSGLTPGTYYSAFHHHEHVEALAATPDGTLVPTNKGGDGSLYSVRHNANSAQAWANQFNSTTPSSTAPVSTTYGGDGINTYSARYHAYYAQQFNVQNYYDRSQLNTVIQSFSLGTLTGTTVPIKITDNGVFPSYTATTTTVTLPAATTSLAGLLTAADKTLLNNSLKTNTIALGTKTNTTIPITITGSQNDGGTLSGTGLTLPAATQSFAGLLTGTDKTKLDGIEASADVTDALNVNAALSAMTDAEATLSNWIFVDTNTSLGTSDEKIPTQKAVKTYVDNRTSQLFEYIGGYNASTNTPALDSRGTAPTINRGSVYEISVAGTFFTQNVEVGDTIIAEQDNPTLESHWTVLQKNLDAASIKVQYESNANTNAFTDALLTKLNGIETAATADQTDAEIETAYNNQVAVVPVVTAEAGTDTTVYRWTPELIAAAIKELQDTKRYKSYYLANL